MDNIQNLKRIHDYDEQEKSLLYEMKEHMEIVKKLMYDIQIIRIKSLIATISNKKEITFDGISDIKICAENRNNSNWNISYVHKTDRYTNLFYIDTNYGAAENTQPHTDLTTKETQINFGYFGDKIKIIGNGNKFEVYQNSSGKIRILFKDLEHECEAIDHETILKQKIYNCDMPEYFALQILSALTHNKWQISDMKILLGTRYV